MRAISLFSGAGGDTLGLEQAGFTVVAFSENNSGAILTHKAKFPHSVLLEYKNQYDITQLPDSVFEEYAGSIDLIFAGFPCQSFSHAGKKRENDPRGELFRHFVRATRIIRPKWIVGENVSGLLSREGGCILSSIIEAFSDIGYNLQHKIIDCTEFGIPQARKRLILTNFEWKHSKIPLVSLRSVVTPVLEGAVEFPEEVDADHRFFLSTDEHHSIGQPHSNLIRLIKGIRGLTPTERACSPDVKEIRENAPLLSFGKRASGYHGEIVNLDQPCKTIICTYASCPRLFVGLVNQEKLWVRTFTTSELAQIQGFPADYPFKGTRSSIVQQIGNAIPPQVARSIAECARKLDLCKTY